MVSPTPPPLKISSDDSRYKLGEKLTNIKNKNEEQETEKRAYELGMPYINLSSFPTSPAVVGLIEENMARESQTVLFFQGEGELRIGVVNPDHTSLPTIIESLQDLFRGTKVTTYLISHHSFEVAAEAYKGVSRPVTIKTEVDITEDDLLKFKEQAEDNHKLQTTLDETGNMTDVFIMIIAAAMKADTSDIHIEAQEEEVNIRFRIDGILQTIATLKKELWPKVISRIKVISKLKINIDSIPQDGRITIAMKDDKMDIRVSTLPSAYGESVVMRLLKSTATSLQFEDLGVRGKAITTLEDQIKRPNGMIITTGPTGSGKTTTLYAILNKLNKPDVKIITLENPVEYKLKGITQSQIDHKKGYTFGKGLRAILRQDPDIVMVGEIRDLETAEIAIQAALTGHLVISTIHTNDAAGAIPRFLSMDVKPFLLAPALNTVLGQRLCRKLCQECKQETEISEKELDRVKKLLSEVPEKAEEKIDLENMKFYKGAGCDTCHKTGYKGRVGIYEIFNMNPEVEKVVLSGEVSEYQMKDIAAENGMVTMIQDGLIKALEGITSVEEVFRVTE